MKVSKGQSQPEIVADIRLLNSLHGVGSTILIPGFDYDRCWAPRAGKLDPAVQRNFERQDSHITCKAPDWQGPWFRGWFRLKKGTPRRATHVGKAIWNATKRV